MGKLIREVCERNRNVRSRKDREGRRQSWVEELEWRKRIRKVCGRNGNVTSWKYGKGGRRALKVL
jgi:hypothetical protein